MSDPLLRYDSDVTGPGPTPNNNAVDVNILLILLPAHLVSCSSLLGRNTGESPQCTLHSIDLMLTNAIILKVYQM